MLTLSLQSHLILSGGLGSSPYVQKKMRERYEMGFGNAPPNASNLKVLLADSPQLAVVLGLVMARIQKAKTSVSVYAEKCSPISLGVLCREKYDQKKHQGEDVQMDPYDKKRWAERQIEWIIRRVSEIPYKMTDQRLTFDRVTKFGPTKASSISIAGRSSWAMNAYPRERRLSRQVSQGIVFRKAFRAVGQTRACENCVRSRLSWTLQA